MPQFSRSRAYQWCLEGLDGAPGCASNNLYTASFLPKNRLLTYCSRQPGHEHLRSSNRRRHHAETECSEGASILSTLFYPQLQHSGGPFFESCWPTLTPIAGGRARGTCGFRLGRRRCATCAEGRTNVQAGSHMCNQQRRGSEPLGRRRGRPFRRRSS